MSCLPLLYLFQLITKTHSFLYLDNSSSSELLDTIDVFFAATAFLALSNELFAIGIDIPDDSPFAAIHVWSWKLKAQVGKLIGHRAGVNTLAKLKDNTTIASGSNDETIRVWNSTSGFLLRNLTGHTQRVTNLLSIGGYHVASCSWDETLRVWNVNSGDVLKQIEGRRGKLDVNCMQLIRENSCLATGSVKTIRLWNLTSGKEMREISQDNDVIRCLLLLSGNDTHRRQLLASGELDGLVKIWHVETCELVSTLETAAQLGSVSALVNLKPDHLASASEDGHVQIWNYQTGQLLQTLKGHAWKVFDLTLLFNGYLASCSQDRTVKVWNLAVIYNNFC
jgi:hypothetical protein